MRKLLYLRFLSIGLFLSFTCLAQERTITGSVISNVDNKPMTGVSVTVKGKNLTTQTNANGNFSITAAKGQILQFSYVGFASYETTIGNSDLLEVTLTSLQTQLGEVVVTALGIKKEKRALGYAVSDLSAKELMKNKNTNVINSLAGKV